MTQDEAKNYFTFDAKHPCPDELDRFSMRDAEGRKKFTEAMAIKHKDFEVKYGREKDYFDCYGVSADTYTIVVEAKDRNYSINSFKDKGWGIEKEKIENLRNKVKKNNRDRKGRPVVKLIAVTCTDGMLVWDIENYRNEGLSEPHLKYSSKPPGDDNPIIKTPQYYYFAEDVKPEWRFDANQ